MFFLPAQRHHEKDILSSHIRTDVMARVQRLGIKQGRRKGSGEEGGGCWSRTTAPPPFILEKENGGGGGGGGQFCTFPIKSVRDEINAKRTIPI